MSFDGRRIVDSRFAGDDGAADPALRRAMASGRDTDVLGALAAARLLVPVMAVLEADDATGEHGEKASQMATPLLPAPGGGRALPAFTGLDALAAWRGDVRPVPVLAADAAAAALEQGCSELVVDVAGPARYVLAGPRLRALAQGRPWTPVWEDAEVRAAIATALRGVTSWELLPAGSPDADAVLRLVVPQRADLSAVAARLADDDTLRTRLERGLDVQVAVQPT